MLVNRALRKSILAGAFFSFIGGWFLLFSPKPPGAPLLMGTPRQYPLDKGVLSLLDQRAPVFRLQDAQGEEHDLGTHKGLALLIFVGSDSALRDSLRLVLEDEELENLKNPHRVVKQLVIVRGHFPEGKMGGFTVLQDPTGSVSDAYEAHDVPIVYAVNWPGSDIINGAAEIAGIREFLKEYSNGHNH